MLEDCCDQRDGETPPVHGDSCGSNSLNVVSLRPRLLSMGMSHDDDHASCKGHSHIMSGEWVKGRNPSDLSWSSCSRDDLENFLR